MGILDDIASAAKSIVKSPVTKVVAGGIAIVAPPFGAPALAAIVAADKVTDAIDKGKAVLKQAAGAAGARAVLPGGRAPVLAAKVQLGAKQASIAANVIKATASAAKTNPHAARNLKLIQVVQQAKAGNKQAQAIVHQEIKKQVANVIKAGSAPNATPEAKQMARVTTALLKGAAARKRHAQSYGVDRRRVRVVRVA